MGSEPSWLERLAERIPGYSGYRDRERRRDIDKLHREHLADRLRSLKGRLTALTRELASRGRLIEVGPIDRILKELDRLENRIRFASYGYSGFFDAVKIEQQQLDAIYQFDLALVERVDGLEAKVNQLLISAAGSPEGLKSGAAEVEGALKEIDCAFDGRCRAISNPGQPPGRPLFS
jgi:hypothetical protein